MLSESTVIARLQRGLIDVGSKQHLGIGDDAAWLCSPGPTLVTCDAMTEGVHFDLSWMGLADAAYRCLSSNLSDIAAMGGVSGPFVLALGIPHPGASEQDIEALVRGFSTALSDHSLPTRAWLVGGDTLRNPGGWSITITLMGYAPPKGAISRQKTQPGDHICIFRTLGNSAAGLAALRESIEGPDEFVRAHRRPLAETQLGAALGAAGCVRAMLDLSDGLLIDLPRLLPPATSARVHLDAIPLHPQLRSFAKTLGYSPWDWAVAGGEDYTLCAIISPEMLEETRNVATLLGRSLSIIGSIISGDSGVEWLEAGKPSPWRGKGFEHFVSADQNL